MLLEEVSDLVASQSDEFMLVAAESAALQFEIPTWITSSDVLALSKAGDIESLIALRQNELRENRFNTKRCRTWFLHDVEFHRLWAIASEGAVIDVADGFVPSTTPAPPRPLLRRLSHTFAKHAFDLWSKRQAILLPLSVALTCGLHFSPVHWTPKPGKPEGRFLCDLSNSPGGNVLNDPGVKRAIDERYGPVDLPSIGDVVDAIFRMADKVGFENIRLWKEDVVGAFNQFNFHPASAKYLAFQIDDDSVLILFTDVFGWQGSPAVFAVFSRALLRCTVTLLNGVVLVYVDDFMGISSAALADQDQLRLRQLVIGVFGDDAINVDKSILPSRIGDCIGWTIDLIRSIIYPNEKGRKKLVSAFFGVDLEKLISVKCFQRLGSLASRYSKVLVGLRPFVHAFFTCASDGKAHHASSDIRLCVAIWRAVALLVLSNPTSLAVPLYSVSTLYKTINFVIISDAGPLGLGVKVMSPSGTVVAFASYRLPFPEFKPLDPTAPTAKESKFQNVREFLGVVLGLLMCKQLCVSSCCVQWVNDNTAALSWVRDNMARSRAAQVSFLTYTWCCLLGRISVEQVQHIPGSTMGDVDSLSRFLPTQNLDPRHDWSSLLPIGCLDDCFLPCDPSGVDQTNVAPVTQCISSTIVGLEKCLQAWH